jgi:hypothetical protein
MPNTRANLVFRTDWQVCVFILQKAGMIEFSAWMMP